MQQELEYIYAVYKAGSFSKAAENLYITQPALSMAVKKIEASIGKIYVIGITNTSSMCIGRGL